MEARRREEERRRRAEASSRKKAAEEKARAARRRAEDLARHSQEHSEELVFAFDNWCKRAAELSQQIRSGQPHMGKLPSLPIKSGISKDCGPSCQAIRRELCVDFCKHSLTSLVKAYALVKFGSDTREQGKVHQATLGKLARLWHPDRFVSGTDKLRKQAEEMSKIVNSLYTIAQVEGGL
ncbi:hypothetical protein LIA77_06023 [Sarocladium implicatum]|nr:hypothetical protein LIA77_06023 [Sarocladium implicatum]